MIRGLVPLANRSIASAAALDTTSIDNIDVTGATARGRVAHTSTTLITFTNGDVDGGGQHGFFLGDGTGTNGTPNVDAVTISAAVQEQRQHRLGCVR